MPDIKARTYYQRGRFISRKIAIDHKPNACDDSTFLLFLMLIPHLDAEGRMQGEPVIIRGLCCPKRDWSDVQLETMLITLQEQKRDDGLGIIERYHANGTHCLWMPGFESEQIGLQKQKEAKGKYGQSDIPPPPKKLVNKMGGVAPVIKDTSFLDELRPEYPELDVDAQWKECKDYWVDKNRQMKRPKAALKRWMDNTRKYKKEKADGKGGKGTRQLKDRHNYTPSDNESV